MYDHRVVKRGKLCYPSPAGHNCWWDELYVYDFEIPARFVAPRTVRSFDEAANHSSSTEVHLRHLPDSTEPVDARLRAECPRWRAPSSRARPPHAVGSPCRAQVYVTRARMINIQIRGFLSVERTEKRRV